MNLIAGTTVGVTLGQLNSGALSSIIQNNTMLGDTRPLGDDCNPAGVNTTTMSGKNVGDLLNAKGLTWGWFQGGFRATATANGVATCASTHNNISGASAGTDYIPHHEPFQFYASTQNLHHMPPTSTANIGKTDQANHQYDIQDFTTALAAGNLPAVSYLKAAAYQDGHAGYSDPLDEQTFVVNTVNALMQSPFWPTTAIIIAYDDSDGWYDHAMPPIVNQSATSSDGLTGAGACGSPSGSAPQGRCGYGPRTPLLVISPYAKVNYVDHTITDQSSILRFIEDNFQLGRIGGTSMDAAAGTLNNMFNFQTATAKTLILDPTMGTPSTGTSGTGGSTGPTGSTGAATKAIISTPNNFSTNLPQIQLDGSQSTSVDGKALTYAWTLAASSPQATLIGANTATPLVQFVGFQGPYVFTLTVTDDKGTTSTATVTVWVP